MKTKTKPKEIDKIEQYCTEVLNERLNSISGQLDSLKGDISNMLNYIKQEGSGIKNDLQAVMENKADLTSFLSKDDRNLLSAVGRELDEIKSYREAHLELMKQVKHPIWRLLIWDKKGKLLCLIFVAILTMVIGSCSLYRHNTAEYWAGRNYRAAVRLDEANPGDAYHHTMFSYRESPEASRTEVSRREAEGRLRDRRKAQYGKTLKGCLSKGVRVTDFSERSGESLVLFTFNRSGRRAIAHIQGGKVRIAYCDCGSIKDIPANPDLKWVTLGDSPEL